MDVVLAGPGLEEQFFAGAERREIAEGRERLGGIARERRDLRASVAGGHGERRERVADEQGVNPREVERRAPRGVPGNVRDARRARNI